MNVKADDGFVYSVGVEFGSGGFCNLYAESLWDIPTEWMYAPNEAFWDD